MHSQGSVSLFVKASKQLGAFILEKEGEKNESINCRSFKTSGKGCSKDSKGYRSCNESVGPYQSSVAKSSHKAFQKAGCYSSHEIIMVYSS